MKKYLLASTIVILFASNTFSQITEPLSVFCNGGGYKLANNFESFSTVGELAVSRFTYNNICGQIGFHTDIGCTEVGLNDLIVSPAISIYPNPSNGKFNLNVSDIKQFEVFAFDMLGQMIFSNHFETDGHFTKLPLDLMVAPGLYTVNVTSDGQYIFNHKVIVVH